MLDLLLECLATLKDCLDTICKWFYPWFEILFAFVVLVVLVVGAMLVAAAAAIVVLLLSVSLLSATAFVLNQIIFFIGAL